MSDNKARIDDVLQTALSVMEQRGWSVAECLAQYPADQGELEPMLRAAEQYRAARELAPSDAFRRQAAARLSARLSQSPRRAEKRSQPTRLFNLPRRFATALMVALVVVALAAATTGTIYAADESLPGDPLYPVEKTVEQVQLTFSPPDSAFSLRLKFAEKRLKEAEKLLKRGDGALMQQALDAYNQLLGEATQSLDTASAPDDPAELDAATAQLTEQQARLEALLDQVPEAAKPGISRAIEASKHGQQRAAEASKKHGNKPDKTPNAGSSNGNGNGNGTGGGNPKQCPDGSSISGQQNGQAHRLASQYGVPFETVRDLFCEGLTSEQVEDRLASATPTP